MDIVFLLLPLALVLVFIGLFAFSVAAKKGQFDDLETPAMRMLFDEEGRRDKVSKDKI